MNMVHVIGNLTADPEIKQVQTSGGMATVTTFTVAVNRHHGGVDYVDYFRVSVWSRMAENAKKFLAKGRKVAVSGAVTARAYTAQDGSPRASLEIVQVFGLEFLSPSNRGEGAAQSQQPAQGNEWAEAGDDPELPF